MNLNRHLEDKEMKPYKGYRIFKTWEADDFKSRPIPGTVLYMVCDDEDAIGDCYKTIREAHRYIDTIAR